MIYISAPSSANTPEEKEHNRQAAINACEDAYQLGRLSGEHFVPITPLVNFTYLNENNSEERGEALRLGMSLLSKCDQLWVTGNRITEEMRGEIRAAARMDIPVFSMELEQEKIQNVVSDLLPMLDEKCCFKNSDENDYTSQLLVLRSSALAPWAKEPENQLWIASHGFGTSPGARGRAVFAKNLLDGEDARFNRSDFYGIADPARLPAWANAALSQALNQNIDESEEIEQ